MTGLSSLKSDRRRGRVDVELRQDVLAERVEEAALLDADVVAVARVEAELLVLGDPLGVLPEVGGYPDHLGDVLGTGVRGGLFEGLWRLQVPGQRRTDDAAAPLLVRQRQSALLLGVV